MDRPLLLERRMVLEFITFSGGKKEHFLSSRFKECGKLIYRYDPFLHVNPSNMLYLIVREEDEWSTFRSQHFYTYQQLLWYAIHDKINLGHNARSQKWVEATMYKYQNYELSLLVSLLNGHSLHYPMQIYGYLENKKVYHFKVKNPTLGLNDYIYFYLKI